MGWLKAVGKGLLWVAKNEQVRTIVIAAVRGIIAKKKADEAAENLSEAALLEAQAARELAAAPKVKIEF
jgi:hypothetical protein